MKYEKQGRNIIYSIKNSETECLLVSLGIRDIKPCCDGKQASGFCYSDKTESGISSDAGEIIKDRAENQS